MEQDVSFIISQAFQVSLPQELWVMKSVDEGLWLQTEESAQFFSFSHLLLLLYFCCFSLVQLFVQIFIASKIFLKDSFLCRSQRLPAWCSRDCFCTLLTLSVCFLSCWHLWFCTRVWLVQKKKQKKKNNEPCSEAPKISEMHLYFPCDTVCCEEKRNINVNLFSYTDWDWRNKGRDVHGPSRVFSHFKPSLLLPTRGRHLLIFLTFKIQQRQL